MSAPLYNPGQPYQLPIPGGFHAGKIAHITGTFAPTATSIVVKLQTGPYGDPNDEIGLCIYGRVEQKLLGCNALTRGTGWGQEEAKPAYQLNRGQQFDLAILCDPTGFKVALNREHLTDFSHKFDPITLTHLNIASGPNDINLSCLWIEDSNNPAPQAYPPPQNYQNPQAYGGSAPGNYHNDPSSSHKSKGLMGMVGSAGAAVAGALGASHLLGKSKGGSGGSHGYNSGYPSQGGGYPSQGGGYPSHGGGYPSQGGGYPSQGGGYPKSSSGGGMMNTALGVGGGLLAAKTAKKGFGGFGGKNALKYGIPLAGAGLGGYMLSKGLSGSFSDDDCNFGGSFDCSDCSDSD